MKKRIWIQAVFVTSLAIMLVQACAQTKPYRMNPQFDTKIHAIQKPGLLPVDVMVYELDAGGIRELRDEWCAEAKRYVQSECIACLAQKKQNVEPLVVTKEMEEELEDVQALYRAVSYSIVFHTYMAPNIFPGKVENFDYTLGPINELLEKCKADALIFIYGQDEISTAGRQALMATGIVLGALTGVYAGPRAGAAVVSVAVVGASGEILWFNVKAGAHYDLRKPDHVKTIMTEIFAEFPAR